MENTRVNDDAVQRKMEEMKMKNAEIMRRHAEVEFDKKNADEFSKTVTVQKIHHPVERKLARISSTRVQRSKITPDVSPKEPDRDNRSFNLLERGDGPPPDPKFSFLSDPSRKRSHTGSNSTSRGPSRRHPNNLGGSDFQNVKTTMEQQKAFAKQRSSEHPRKSSENDLTISMTGKERIEYNKWLREREEVDRSRIERQRTAAGTWTREWDAGKVLSDDEFETFGKTDSRDLLSSRDLSTPGSTTPSNILLPEHVKVSSHRGRNRAPGATKPVGPKPLSNTTEKKKQPWNSWTYLRRAETHVANLPGFGAVSIKPLYPGWKPKNLTNDKSDDTLQTDEQLDSNTPVVAQVETNDISVLMDKLILDSSDMDQKTVSELTLTKPLYPGQEPKIPTYDRNDESLQANELFDSNNSVPVEAKIETNDESVLVDKLTLNTSDTEQMNLSGLTVVLSKDSRKVVQSSGNGSATCHSKDENLACKTTVIDQNSDTSLSNQSAAVDDLDIYLSDPEDQWEDVSDDSE